MDDSNEMISFPDVLQALSDNSAPFPARYLRSFSDLSRKNLKELMVIWPHLTEARKISLLEDLEHVMESDTLVNYDVLAQALLVDSLAAVRVSALHLLWETEEENLIPILMKLSLDDPNEDARAAAVSLLGKFILLGELEAISANLKDGIEKLLIEIVQGKDQDRVRRFALEALGYSSHTQVPSLIEKAYQSSDAAWVSSALCAMGRSADDSWAPQVGRMLASPSPEIQFEAVRAAGELELVGLREEMLSLLQDGVEDEEVRLALIWSLSQIGGDDVKERLEELLADAVDDEEIEWIERAIENMDFSTSGNLKMYDFSPEDEEIINETLDEDDFLDDEDFEGFETDEEEDE
mgnify:FL=1